MVDIRRKTTYLYRNADGRHIRGLTSFLQVNAKNSVNIDPENGMNLVGPMLKLTACAELKPDEDDFDAVYPDSSLSYGPTACSIGLKYNDHNYAIPSGLTPPSMAPHLMDVSMPRMKFNHSVRKSLHRSADGLSPSASDHESNDAAKRIEEALHSGEFTYRAQTTNATSDFNAWTSNADVSENSGREPFTGSRFMRGTSVCERLEMRSEPEMKVIEVPEEMAVSPSQLSDLDSDLSEVETSSKIQYQITVVDGNLIQGSVLPNIRCICNTVQYKTQLISCPYCGFYQHVGCMGNFYGIPLPQLSEGYTCSFCRDTGSCHRTGLEIQPPAQLIETQGQAIQDAYNKIARDSQEESAPVITTTSSGTQFTDSQVGGDSVPADSLKRVDQNSLLSPCSSNRFPDKARTSNFKENEGVVRQPYTSSEWELLSDFSRLQKRPINDTNVNLRMPSPPRASKRKQDLTSTSYNESDVASATVAATAAAAAATTTAVPGGHPVGSAISNCSSADEFSCPSSANQTPISTPLNTPQKLLMQPVTPRTPLSTPGAYPLTPRSEYSSSSGLDSSPNSSLRIGEKRRHKRLTPSKLQLGVRANPFGSAWLKDYKEISNNEYSSAIVEYVNNRVGTNVERNHRIPPSCLTRSSLCRVVYFDHDEMGLEAYIRLGANEMVTEVRGKFLLMEEYEHYLDPTSDYRRYVMFYHGFGDRVVVIDSSQCGNNARFIRRSCIPNCRLEHYVVQGKLQVVIRTTTEVMPGAELTLPFDMDFHACRYQLNCACARSRCPVVKWGRKLVRNKVVPRLDYQKFIESQLRYLSETRQEGSSGRSSNYESSALSGSPLVRTPIGASTSSPSSQPPPGQNAGLTFLLSPTNNSNLQTTVKKNNEDVINSTSVSTNDAQRVESRTSQDAATASFSNSEDSPAVVNSCADASVSTTVKNTGPSETTSKPRFEPVITTRRQAAVMRSAVR